MPLLESYWIKLPWWSVRKVFKIIWLASLGVLLIGIIVFTLYMNSLPSLSTWHTTILENEFHMTSNVKDFEDYITLEEKLTELLDWVK